LLSLDWVWVCWCKDAVVSLFIMEPGSVPCFSKKNCCWILLAENSWYWKLLEILLDGPLYGDIE
jgi:hypothetical protein